MLVRMVMPPRALTPLGSVLFLYFRRNLSEKVSSSSKFIHESYLPTDCFQKSLPHLKVPDVSKTLERYLLSQEAICSAEQYLHTKKVTDDFMKSAGPELQTSLLNYDKRIPESNYVSKIWFDMYLRDRRALALTHNPALVFNDSAIGADYNKPTIRATNMICSSLRFLETYRAGKLKPEVYHLNPQKSDTLTFERFIGLLPRSIATYAAYMFKAFPLDMSQFDWLFGSTRIAAAEQDELRKFPGSRHVAVISKGDIFIFDVIDEKGCHLSPRQILANLEFIQHQPARTQRMPNRSSGIGIITAMPRDTALMARDRLESLGNRRNLDLIDSALFVLVLSQETTDHFPGVLSDMVAGPADSRWFEKSFSLIVNQSGTAGINFEHSWGDGIAVLRFFNEIFKDTESRPAVHPDVLCSPDSLPAASVQRLEWLVDDLLFEGLILPAWQDYEARRADLQINILQTTGILHKSKCKRAGLSPDAMLQLAIQMAHDKVHCCPAATYESCSTAAFKHGRTETIRSATLETRRFLELIRRHKGSVRLPVSDCDLREALIKCSVKHNQLSKEAAMGQGWDRHLFVLKHFAEETAGGTKSLPSIFEDPNYRKINQIILSTSTLSSPALQGATFAPTDSKGYGVGYLIDDKGCSISTSSWRSSKYSSGLQFVDAFHESIKELSSLIDSNN